jgi:hypothetical protein
MKERKKTHTHTPTHTHKHTHEVKFKRDKPLNHVLFKLFSFLSLIFASLENGVLLRT